MAPKMIAGLGLLSDVHETNQRALLLLFHLNVAVDSTNQKMLFLIMYGSDQWKTLLWSFLYIWQVATRVGMRSSRFLTIWQLSHWHIFTQGGGQPSILDTNGLLPFIFWQWWAFFTGRLLPCRVSFIPAFNKYLQPHCLACVSCPILCLRNQRPGKKSPQDPWSGNTVAFHIFEHQTYPCPGDSK